MEKLFEEYCKEDEFLKETYIEELKKLNDKYKDHIEKMDEIENKITYWVEETYSTLKETPNDYFSIDWERLREEKTLYILCIYPGEEGDEDNWEYARITVPTEAILKKLTVEEAKDFIRVTK